MPQGAFADLSADPAGALTQMYQQRLAELEREDRFRKEDRDLAREVAGAKSNRDISKEYRSAVQKIAQEIFDTRNSDGIWGAEPVTMEDAMRQAEKIVGEQYGGGALDSMRHATDQLQKTLQEIRGQ